MFGYKSDWAIIPDAGVGAVLLTNADNGTNEALGGIKMEHQGTNTGFHFEGRQSTVASRKNDDGTISLVAIDPTRDGFAFVRAERNGKRSLVVRDAQHEYVFTETD